MHLYQHFPHAVPPSDKSLHERGIDVFMVDDVKHQVLVDVRRPPGVLVLLPAAVLHLINGIFHTPVLDAQITFSFVQAPDISGMGIQQLPYEMHHLLSFHSE